MKSLTKSNSTMIKLQNVLIKQNNKDYRQVMANTKYQFQQNLTTPATRIVGDITNGIVTVRGVTQLQENSYHPGSTSQDSPVSNTSSCRKGKLFLI